MSQIYDMEQIFNSQHSDSISSQQKIIKTFYLKCQSLLPKLPPPVIMKYARTRTFIRIRFLNSKLKATQVHI